MAILTTIGGIPLFRTQSAAEKWARSNNLTGFHTHTYNGIVGYMGGKNHSNAVGSDSSSGIFINSMTFGRSNATTPRQGQTQAQRRRTTTGSTPTQTGGTSGSTGGGGGGY